MQNLITMLNLSNPGKCMIHCYTCIHSLYALRIHVPTMTAPFVLAHVPGFCHVHVNNGCILASYCFMRARCSAKIVLCVYSSCAHFLLIVRPWFRLDDSNDNKTQKPQFVIKYTDPGGESFRRKSGNWRILVFGDGRRLASVIKKKYLLAPRKVRSNSSSTQKKHPTVTFFMMQCSPNMLSLTKPSVTPLSASSDEKASRHWMLWTWMWRWDWNDTSFFLRTIT